MRTLRFRGLLGAAAMLAGCLVAVVPAAPATAGTVAAMDRCSRTAVPEIDTTIEVRGNGGGAYPAEAVPTNAIEPGDVFYVAPAGGTVATGAGGTVGPDGNGQPAPSSFPYPGMRKYSAILRFNNDPAGWRGVLNQATAFARCFRWNDSLPVRMLFGVNDDDPSDNQGAWRLRVLVYKASAPESHPQWDRCRYGGVPSPSEENVWVYGNGGGSFPTGPDPGNILNNGDVFNVVFKTGTVGTGPGSPSVGPYGNGEPAPNGWPYPGLFRYSAVLRFNNDPTGWVNPPQHAAALGGCRAWTGPSVRMLFGVNDTVLWDNGGAWRFGVYIYR